METRAESRPDPLRPVFVLAALVLLGLGLAKVAAPAPPGEASIPELAPEETVRWQQRARVQGVLEIRAGAAVLLLPGSAAGLVLATVGAGFLTWQFLETPEQGPCPCLAGLRSWIPGLARHEAEWRMTLAVWFFLTGVLGWRSARDLG
ncbi:MAG: hypothetical protein N2438_03635 [Limisphaera sp.]|nr:hypothetical protein [Limisphaera sp.]